MYELSYVGLMPRYRRLQSAQVVQTGVKYVAYAECWM